MDNAIVHVNKGIVLKIKQILLALILCFLAVGLGFSHFFRHEAEHTQVYQIENKEAVLSCNDLSHICNIEPKKKNKKYTFLTQLEPVKDIN